MKHKFFFTFYSHLPYIIKILFYRLYLFFFFSNQLNKNKEKVKKIQGLNKSQKITLNLLSRYERSHDRFLSFLEGFLYDEINLVYKNFIDQSNTSIVFVSVINSPKWQIELQYQNLIKMGIDKFVYIDNGSPLETINFIKSKPNTLIYKVNTKYNSSKKNGWINRILQIECQKKYVLVLDSDESITFKNKEDVKLSIKEFISKYKISQFNSFMVDIYTNLNSSNKISSISDFNILPKYFDTKYTFGSWFTGNQILGGPKNRINEKLNINHTAKLTKVPLFYYGQEFIFMTHNPLPIKKNFSKKILVLVIHYQLIYSTDFSFNHKTTKGDYFNNGIEYKVFSNYKKEIIYNLLDYKDTLLLSSNYDFCKIKII